MNLLIQLALTLNAKWNCGKKTSQHIEGFKSSIFQLGLGSAYLNECVKAIVYIINQISSLTLGNETPFELLYKKQANLSNLKEFRCLCFITSSILGRN